MDKDDSIAIVGVGCMFPGARNLEEFWRVLINEEDHLREIPLDKFSVDAFYDEDPNTPGKSYVRNAGILQDHDQWDNHFFGISENETKHMDPQQRHVLECVQMALEDGGIPRKKVNGSNTGVYIGAMNHDFHSYTEGDTTMISNYTVTGISPSIISARVSYFYNLLGPSVTLDTACSSSLVAIHTAVNAMRAGDIDMAVCGGVSSIINPEVFISLSKARMASPTGHCHTFSKFADGYARGEGCGIVILKRLKEAIEDRDKVWATILTGCNQDGHTNTPITAPSQIQQEKLLEAVYLKNGIDPSLVQYIEAHGTGTPVGDPIEANALGRFFSSYSKNSNRAIKIGSVKTNIGHLESAAGVAGLIKVLLMMKKGTIVKSLHSEYLNPKIPFEKYKLEVVQASCKWPLGSKQPRLACINSFGFGGTNSHAVLQQIPKHVLERERRHTDIQYKKQSFFSKIITLSAESPESLIKYFNSIQEFLDSTKYSISMANLSYTTCVRRDHFRFRKMICSNTIEELKSEIQEATVNQSMEHQNSLSNPRVIFVFGGVGTTWQGMCKEFMETSEIFKNAIEEIDECLKPLTDFSIMETYLLEKDVIDDPFANHIAICACQIALTKFWVNLGVTPSAIVGQSVGEVAAAYAAGSLTLEQAIYIIYHRSSVLEQCTGGVMTVVKNCKTSDVENVCSTVENGKANIAVYLSASACTISGDKWAIEEAKSKIKLSTVEPVKFIDLNAKCAYHSHFTAAAGNHLQNLLRNISTEQPKVPVFSSVTGNRVEKPFYASTEYWKDNVKQPVRFCEAVLNSTSGNKDNIFLEISPRPVLSAHMEDIFPDSNWISLPSLHMKKERRTFIHTLSRLYELGVNFDWDSMMQKEAKMIDIPGYVYTKKALYMESEQRTQIKTGGSSVNSVRMMKIRPGTPTEFSLSVDQANTPFVYEHLVEGLAIVPGAMYGEVGFEIGHSLLQAGTNEMEVSWRIENPCIVHGDEKKVLSVICMQQSDKHLLYKVVSKTNSTVFAEGSVAIHTSKQTIMLDIREMKHTISKDGNTDLYQRLRSLGFTHGKTFQIIKRYTNSNIEALAEVELSPFLLKESYKTFFHPVIIDGMLQCCFPAYLMSPEYKNSRFFPSKIGSLVLHHHPVRGMFCYAKFHGLHDNIHVADILLLRSDGIVIAEMKGFEFTILNGLQDLSSITYTMSWDPFYIEQAFGRKFTAFLVTFSEEVVAQLKTIMWKKKMRLEVFLIRKTDEYTEILENMKSKLGDTKSSLLPTILFIPGFTTGKQILECGEDVYGCVQKTCQFLMRFVQNFSSTSVNAMCVTERTQSTADCQDENINILGSELWGMVRSLTREIPSITFTLVDVSPSIMDTLDDIFNILAKISSGDKTLPSEIKLTGPNAFKSKIKHLQQKEGKGRLLTRNIKHTDEVFLRSDEKETLKTIFGVPMDCKTTSNKFLNVVFKSAFVGTEKSFRSKDKDCTFRDYLPKQKDMGYPIIACEVEGFIKHNQSKNEGCKQVISCYPIELATEVQIPKDCVALKSDIPNYSPGLLHKAILALNIADNITPRSKVCIFFDDSFPGISDLLEIFLLEKKCVVETKVNKGDFGDVHSLNFTHVVVAARQTTRTLEEFQILVPTAIRLIAFQGCFPNLSFYDTDQTNPLSQILLDETAIFCTNGLLMSFQRTVRWLTTLSRKGKIPKRSYADNNEIIRRHELEGLQLKIPRELLLKRDAAYIVVGGLTGLGWVIVKYLAANGAKVVITLSRKNVTKEISKRIANIQRLHGVKVCHFPVDISNLQMLMSTLQQIKVSFPTTNIKGIFHGAGVTEDVRVMNMTEEKLVIPLKPKVLGTWNLHIASLSMNLDYFIMHSSIVSILGHEGQSNYGAANAFMDSLAAFRRKQGYPAQSINWGALEVGMANERIVREGLKMEGIGFLTRQQIRLCISKSALSSFTQVCFVDIRWDLFTPASLFGNDRINSKFSDVVKSKAGSNSPKRDTTEMKSDAFSVLSGSDGNDLVSETEQLQKMIDIVHYNSADVLAVHKSEITPQSMLVDFGLDSQKATELINSLYKITRVRIPYVHVISGDKSVKDLAEYILEQHKKGSSFEAEANLAENTTFIEDSLTYMEKMYLDMLDRDPDNPHLTITVDYKISERISSAEFWVTVLQILVLHNPELRTVYRQAENEKRWGYKKEVLDPEDTIVDFRVCTDEDDFKQASKSQERHNPMVDLPIRALFFRNREGASLRMIFSHCSIDMASSMTIANDMRNIVKSILLAKQNPSKFRRNPIDIALIMEEKLQPQLESLESFWKAQLQINKDIPTVKSLHKVPVHLSETNVSIRLFNEIFVGRIQKYLQTIKQTLFGFICTIYQIVLHKLSKASAVSVISAVDLRNYDIMELRDRVGLGVNFVPLTADLSETNLPLESILLNNCMAMKYCISNCFYPYAMLKALDCYDSEKHGKHTIIIDDMTYLDDIQDGDVQLAHLGANQDRTYETALSVFYDQKRCYLELRLGFQEGVVEDFVAETILKYMEELVDIYLTEPSQQLANWIPKYDVMKHISPKLQACFFKFNAGEGGHHVNISLVSPNNQASSGIYLEWGKTNGRRLSLADVSVLKGKCYRGLPSIILETNGKEHIFGSEDRHLVQAWVLLIRQKIKDTESNKH